MTKENVKLTDGPQEIERGHPHRVFPARAGIQIEPKRDSRFHGKDKGCPATRLGSPGFSLLELVVVILLLSLLVMPLLQIAGSGLEPAQRKKTEEAMAGATAALVAFAASNNGCLPFAADYEGSIPDTDAGGDITSGDDGENKFVSNVGYHSGDLPFAELGLGPDFLDGNGLRIQYYVSSYYTDENEDYICLAGHRGFEWKASADYKANGNDEPVYVYRTESGVRKLYKFTNDQNAGDPPGSGDEVTGAYPATMLQLRRGPDITAASPQSDVLSAQNVFVLIATGDNNNAILSRNHMRDANHKADTSGTDWALNQAVVDNVVFSRTRDTASDPVDDGGDTLRVVSFLEFKSKLAEYGLNMEMVCDDSNNAC